MPEALRSDSPGRDGSQRADLAHAKPYLTMAEAEFRLRRAMVARALRDFPTIQAAADALGISRFTLFRIKREARLAGIPIRGGPL